MKKRKTIMILNKDNGTRIYVDKNKFEQYKPMLSENSIYKEVYR